MVTFTLVGVLSIIHVISLCISGISAILLWRSWTHTRNPLTNNLMWFFVFVFLWMSAYFLTLLLTTKSFVSSAGWELATSHGFFLVGLAFLAKIATAAAAPKYEKPVFWVTLLLAVAITLGGLILRFAATDKAQVGDTNALIINVSAVLTIAVLLPSLLIFLARGLQSANVVIKARSLLFATGFTLLLWHGISLVFIPSQRLMPWIMGEALNVLAFTLLLAGILYYAPRSEESSASSAASTPIR